MIIVSILTKELENRKYVLTYGYGSESFEDAKAFSDFAAYEGVLDDNDTYIAHSGNKLSRSKAVELFGATFGLKEENFRR